MTESWSEQISVGDTGKSTITAVRVNTTKEKKEIAKARPVTRSINADDRMINFF